MQDTGFYRHAVFYRHTGFYRHAVFYRHTGLYRHTGTPVQNVHTNAKTVVKKHIQTKPLFTDPFCLIKVFQI